jgi:alanine racemase
MPTAATDEVPATGPGDPFGPSFRETEEIRHLHPPQPDLTDPTIPGAHAILDLAALPHNLARLRRCAPQAKVMAVIKANAYGHGLLRCARVLAAAGADAFAVARVDEGVVLREAGIGCRIAVLQGFITAAELQQHRRYRLEPVVHSELQVSLLEQAPEVAGLALWIKLDSGMHRLGLGEQEFADCYRRLQRLPGLSRPIPLMTHLANADVLSDPVTGRQLDRFHGLAAAREGERSIANSAALLAWENAKAEWVRPGIALYGVSPFPHRTAEEDGMRPVMTLRTRLIAIKPLGLGDAVGYGGDWVCQHPTRMGVAAIGYGDGYPRHARSGTPALVRGKRVRLIGRVSMDMITLDLNDCPEAAVGDTVTLWGDGLPVEEVARHADTIPYVLLCNVTPRVKLIERTE